MTSQEKIRVFIFGKLPPPYMGPSIATKILLESSLKNEFDLTHIDTRINTSLDTMGKFNTSKLWGQIRIYARLLVQLIRKRPSIALIPISQSKGGFIKDSFSIILSCVFGARVLIHLRGSEFRTRMEHASFFYKAYLRFVLNRCAGAIVLGQNLRPIFHGWFPENRIYVCPNGGDFEFPIKTEVDPIKFRLLSIGNLQPGKGIEDLLQALCELPGTLRDRLELTLLGCWRDEETRIRCLKLIKDYSLPVLILGQEESVNKFKYLAHADLFVFVPRDPEGHPWVIVEAMAAGLPIISTNRGAIIESVQDGSNGYIVPSNDPGQLANRIIDLFGNPEKRKRMGEISRKMYLERFTEKCMTDQLSRIIKSVIAQKE
jgi:glycosyltransferase involved in cell wall biosynthesis